MQKKPIYIGLHVHKCAGTSLQIHLAECARAGSWFWHTSPDVNYRQSNLEIEEKNISSRTIARVIWGHEVFDYFLGFFASRPIYLFTFLRHPVKRLVSWYRYEARSHEKFTGSLDDFESFPRFIANRQNHMCYFILNRFPHLDDSSSDLLHARAIAVLEKFAFVGLQEDFKTGASQLMRFIGLPDLRDGMKKNVDDGRIEFDYDTDAIASMNSSDMALFRYASERYQRSSIPDKNRTINPTKYGIDNQSSAFREFIELRCRSLTNRLSLHKELDAYCNDNLRKIVYLLIRQCFAETDTTQRECYQKILIKLANQFNLDLNEKDILQLPFIQSFSESEAYEI